MSSIPPVVDAAPSQRASHRDLRQRWRSVVRLVLLLALGGWSLLLLAWLSLYWGILPRIGEWRPQIEAQASRVLGVPVRIGTIEARSGGWVPAFVLKDVVLSDARGQPALTLPSISAALSPNSLIALEPRFRQLLIEGAQLEVRRDAQGRLSVAGLEVGRGGGDTGNALRDWVFSQHEIVVRGSSLRWRDEMRDAPPLALNDVSLVIRNGLRRHELRLDATPEAAWGDRFNLRGRFTQALLAEAGDWSRWSGEAFAELPRVDVRELRRHVSLPFELSEGDGAVRAWVELRDGQPRATTADVALRAVTMRLAHALEPLQVEQVQGRLVGRRSDDGVSLALQRFGFVTGDGVRWPEGDLSLSWTQRGDGPVQGGEFSAERLDLAVIAQVAGRLPLGSALRDLLASLKPEGQVSALAGSWQGPVDAPTRYRAKAQLDGLALAALPSPVEHAVGRPGLRNASIKVEASEGGGSAQLSMADGAIEFPGVFEQPLIPLTRLAAQLAWKIERPAGATEPRIALQVKDARFANADAEGELDASWSTGAGSGVASGGRLPGVLDMTGKLTRGDATQIARYLPERLSPAVRHYVARAVKSGTVAGVVFRVKGDLWDFPFDPSHGAKGEFRIAGQVQDATFAYVPDVPGEGDEPGTVSPWPAFTALNGELVFDRGGMQIRNAKAKLGNLALGPVQGSIKELRHAVLTIDGTARGPLAEMVRFVNDTPVGTWTSRALARATASGNAELKLALSLPFAEMAKSGVKGSVTLAGNDLRLAPDLPPLGAARGRVDFNEKGFAIVGGGARVAGGDASVEGGTQPDGSLRFSIQGTAGAEGLRRTAELGPLARLAGAMSGQTPYRLSLGFVGGRTEFDLQSSLAGLGIDLPAPLQKGAEAMLPLRVQTRPDPAAGPQADVLVVDLGRVVQARWWREREGDRLRVTRGGIGILEPAPEVTAGVTAVANLPQLHLDDWERVIDRLLASPAGSAGAGGAATSASREDVEASGYAPTRIALRAQQLHTGTRLFNRVVAGISRDEAAWRATVEADQLNGYLEYRPPRSGQAAGRVYARLARLSLPKGDVDEVERALDAQQPTTVPALDIVVDDFELRGKRLGRVEIDAVNRIVGEGRDAVREWRLARFAISSPEAQLSGTGQWAEVGTAVMTVPGAAATARRRAMLNFRLDVNNAGGLLERLGTPRAIRGGKGVLTGDISWLGSPLSLDYGSLSGNVNVALDAGQFLKAEPGATRLLSVLSLQSLPRRLALDFRDVFQEGFAFDSITGDVKIAQGVARTNNLRMRGAQAAVLMEGNADLERETQELRVVVVPEINAGTASLAYAAINPAIGLGTFLAQALLRKPLIAAGTREFTVSGSWADPKVERVERKLGDAVPDVDAPLPPASAPAAKETNR